MAISPSFFNFFGICQVPNGSKFNGLAHDHGHRAMGTHICGQMATEHGQVKNRENFRILPISQKYGKTYLQIFFYYLSYHICWCLGQKNPKIFGGCFLLQADKVGMVRF